MVNEQRANGPSSLIESLERALITADELKLTDVAIYINHALVALGAEPPIVCASRAVG